MLVMRAAVTLLFVTALQSVVMGVYVHLREPGELTRVLKAWPMGAASGLCGAGASAAWFTAFTLQIAAYVTALAQIELPIDAWEDLRLETSGRLVGLWRPKELE